MRSCDDGNKDVLQFIDDFYKVQASSDEERELLRKQLGNDRAVQNGEVL